MQGRGAISLLRRKGWIKGIRSGGIIGDKDVKLKGKSLILKDIFQEEILDLPVFFQLTGVNAREGGGIRKGAWRGEDERRTATLDI